MKYPIYSNRTVYPEDIECVWEAKNGKGGIYVGNLEASQNLLTLKKHRIKSILTAAKDINLKHPKSQIPYYLHVPGEDHQRFDLSKYFDKSIDFIANSLKQTNILVHCMAGISRSVTLVLAYLMKHHNMSYQQAFEAVRRKRKIINPNRGFIRQLQQFEKLLSNQSKAMRRSCDNFQTHAHDYSIQKPRHQEPDYRQALHQSIRRNVPQEYSDSIKRYSTIGDNEEPFNQNVDRYRYNTKFEIPRRNKNQNPSGGYEDLNRELDEKIASIRKKYMQATDLLNRQQKKKTVTTNYKSRPYFNDFNQTRGFFVDLDKSDTSPNFQEDSFVRNGYPDMKKTISANETRTIRTASSYANYSNPRKAQGYMYYNY